MDQGDILKPQEKEQMIDDIRRKGKHIRRGFIDSRVYVAGGNGGNILGIQEIIQTPEESFRNSHIGRTIDSIREGLVRLIPKDKGQ